MKYICLRFAVPSVLMALGCLLVTTGCGKPKAVIDTTTPIKIAPASEKEPEMLGGEDENLDEDAEVQEAEQEMALETGADEK